MDLQLAKSRLIESLYREISDKRVLSAMERVAREYFIPADLRELAYEDRPLSIGFGQTISQPFIIALMTQALELKGNEKVLELGTGSGYQTAILAELAGNIISVERIPELVKSAKKRLEHLGYKNIEIRLAEETILGWEGGKPYDAILVTAGAPKVPQVLIDQLSLGGRLVIPVGSKWEQELLKITKNLPVNITENLGYCRFVPLIGPDAWIE